MNLLIEFLKMMVKTFIGLVIILVFSAIIMSVSFGTTFGARVGWLLGTQFIEQTRMEHVEESLRETTVNP